MNTHIYVELIAPNEQLEAFLREVSPMLANRAITFSQTEDWSWAVQTSQPVSVPVS